MTSAPFSLSLSLGDYVAALGKYSLALSHLDDDLLLQLDGFYLDKAHATKMPVHLNMAAALLRLEDWEGAVGQCNQALALEPGSAKALFRRGRARLQLGRTEEAISDLEQALKT